jgi:hypothetical protein
MRTTVIRIEALSQFAQPRTEQADTTAGVQANIVAVRLNEKSERGADLFSCGWRTRY